MIEKDNIQDLFSKAFENQTAPVNPEVWSGIQAKMAAAGIAGAGTAAKGFSLLSKWLIGTGVVGSIGVAATVILMNRDPQVPREQVEKQTTNKLSSKVPSLEPEQVESTERLESTKSYSVNQDNPSSESNEMVIVGKVPVIFNQTPPTSEVVPEVIKPKIPETTVVLSPVDQPIIEENTAPEIHPETEETKMVVLRKQVVEFPNIFTPNNDGVNDFYSVKIEHVKEVEIQIMNQKNIIVYRSNDPNFQWDGRVNGDPCEEGMYVCIVLGKAENGKTFKDMQMFQVMR